MAAIDFPDNPADNDTFDVDGTTWQYNVIDGWKRLLDVLPESTDPRIDSPNTDNIGVGSGFLGAGFNGSRNTVVGDEAGKNLISSNNSVLIGAKVAPILTNAHDNIIIGTYAAEKLSSSSANGNVLIGNRAADNSVASIVNTVVIGTYSEIGAPNSATDNEIVIGAYAIGKGANTVTLGDPTVTRTQLYGYVNPGSFTVAEASALANVPAGAFIWVSDNGITGIGPCHGSYVGTHWVVTGTDTPIATS